MVLAKLRLALWNKLQVFHLLAHYTFDRWLQNFNWNEKEKNPEQSAGINL